MASGGFVILNEAGDYGWAAAGIVPSRIEADTAEFYQVLFGERAVLLTYDPLCEFPLITFHNANCPGHCQLVAFKIDDLMTPARGRFQGAHEINIYDPQVCPLM